MTVMKGLPSASYLRLSAHVELALRWCEALQTRETKRDAVRNLLEQLGDAGEQLRTDAGADLAAQEAVVDLTASIEDCLSSLEALPDLADAVDHLKALYDWPPPPTIERIRALHHELRNRATPFALEPALRRLLERASEAAGDAGDTEAVQGFSAIASKAALDPSEVRSAVAAIREGVATAVRQCRRRLEQLSELRQHPRRFRRAVIVDDVEEQRAVIRFALELATADAPLASVLEAEATDEAMAILARDPNPREVLLITDLGLPTVGADAASWSLTAGRTLVEAWASRCATIVVTAHGRLFDDFCEVMKAGPDAFIAKQGDWANELEGVIARRVSPHRFLDAELDVLTFTGTTALLDGIPIHFTPLGFAWLDALADPRRVVPGVERFDPGTPQGHSPIPKTLAELGLSLIMSASVDLGDDTDKFWADVERVGRDRYLGEYVNARARGGLRAYNLEWDGDLVESETDTGDRKRDLVPWDQWKHRLSVKTVRRWTSASGFRLWIDKRRQIKVLVIESDGAYREPLIQGIRQFLGVAAVEASDADGALTAAREQHPGAVVLGSPELLPATLRRDIVDLLGPVPMVALVGSNDPAVRRSLFRREGKQQADWRTDLLGRVLHTVVKGGNPSAEAVEVVVVLFELVQSIRRTTLSAASHKEIPRVQVARSSEAGFVLNGQWRPLRPVARSMLAPAHAVLVVLAELANIPVGFSYLRRRLIEAGILAVEPRKDYRQFRDRIVGAIRKAIWKPIVDEQGETATKTARSYAETILVGNDPYELRGRVELLDDLPPLGGRDEGVP